MRIKHWVLSGLMGCLVLLCWLALEQMKVPRENIAGRERDVQPQIPPGLEPESTAPIVRNDSSNGDGQLRSKLPRENPKAVPDIRDDNWDDTIDPEVWPEEPKPIKPPQPSINQRMPLRDPGEATMGRSAVRPPFEDKNTRNRSNPYAIRLPKNIPPWFKDYDNNEDGMVSLAEWKVKENRIREFRKYDLNEDGFITIAELIRSGQFTTGTPMSPVLAGMGAEIGNFYYFELTGTVQGMAWGTDHYTTDSPMALVAVHAGILRPGEKGFVKVTILPGESQYHGSEFHGVTTHDRFEGYHKSFTIEAVR